MKTWLGATLVVTLVALGGCGDDDGGGTPDAGGGGGGQAPVISMVHWEPAGACSAGVTSNFTITTTVTDPDTDVSMVTLNGVVTSCTPAPFTGKTQTIRCPNLAPYPGTITVTDPQGNKDTATFTINICETKTVNP